MRIYEKKNRQTVLNFEFVIFSIGDMFLAVGGRCEPRQRVMKSIVPDYRHRSRTHWFCHPNNLFEPTTELFARHITLLRIVKYSYRLQIHKPIRVWLIDIIPIGS